MIDTTETITHAWNVTPAEAVATQSRLASLVQRTDGFDLSTLHTVGGVDASLKGEGQAAIAVLSFPALAVTEKVVATARLEFPYIPGLLSFREAPLILAALAKLTVRPQLLLVDGQGIAHPRRFGIACHLGVLTGIPTIGVAKSLYVGTYAELGLEVGSESPLLHRGEVIGTVLRSKLRTNPLFISIGHKVSLPTAVEVVKRCLHGYRLPEPTRAAHNHAGTAAEEPVSDPRIQPAIVFETV